MRGDASVERIDSLKNVSGSLEMPYEEVVNRVTAWVSPLTQASPKTGRGDERSLSCSMVARSTKYPSDGFMGYAVISGNLAQGFVMFNDTTHHVRPFFWWDAIVRLTWTRMLL